MIIGLSGKKQSGKDTSAVLLKNALIKAGYEVEILSFARPLKEMAGILLNMNPEEFESERVKCSPAADWLPETMTVRKILQILGSEIGHQLGASVWVDRLLSQIKAKKEANPKKFFIITDVRFPNEAGKILVSGGLLIRLEVPGVGQEDQHVSETALDEYSFKYVIVNKKENLSELSSALKTILQKEFELNGLSNQWDE